MWAMLVYSSSLANRAGHHSKAIKEKTVKPSMVVYACNFSPKGEALGQKLKISLGYIVNSKSTCDRWDPVWEAKWKELNLISIIYPLRKHVRESQTAWLYLSDSPGCLTQAQEMWWCEVSFSSIIEYLNEANNGRKDSFGSWFEGYSSSGQGYGGNGSTMLETVILFAHISASQKAKGSALSPMALYLPAGSMSKRFHSLSKLHHQLWTRFSNRSLWRTVSIQSMAVILEIFYPPHSQEHYHGHSGSWHKLQHI